MGIEAVTMATLLKLKQFLDEKALQKTGGTRDIMAKNEGVQGDSKAATFWLSATAWQCIFEILRQHSEQQGSWANFLSLYYIVKKTKEGGKQVKD